MTPAQKRRIVARMRKKTDAVEWLDYLDVNPDFGAYCDWSRVGKRQWARLLRKHPELAVYRSGTGKK
jgi:hypothetical protein